MVSPEGLEPPVFGGVFREFSEERSRRADERGAGGEKEEKGAGRRIQRAATCGLIETYQASLHSTFLEPPWRQPRGQNDSFFSQPPYKCYLEEVASVGD